MKPAIKIENVSKQYRLGVISTGTLSHDLNRWWANMRGKDDPFLKIGETNQQKVKGNSEYVWALKDINLDIMPGDVLGIIGKNGAGKSTLLKLLSRVTAPTWGRIQIRGRIASLLEVGTGFHPELTGRENVFLNGAILGMTKNEIRRKFDEIVDFAGVERYIDTPVKRYSSGMYVRLAFAVAAHLEPDIMVVDEVLAVGDAEFQKKSISKMEDVSKNEGKTILFVSHNMNSVNRLCKNGVVLSDGMTLFRGPIENAIEKYLSISRTSNSTFKEFEAKENVDMQVRRVFLTKTEIETYIEQTIATDEKITIVILYEINIPIKNLHLAIYIKNNRDEVVFFSDITDSTNRYIKVNPGTYKVRINIPNPLLNIGLYSVSLGCVNRDTQTAFHENDVISFELIELNNFRSSRPGYIYQPLVWEINKL